MNSKEISDRVEDCLQGNNRMWMYRGQPRPETPHALLISGQHADGYVDVSGYLKSHPQQRKEFAGYLLDLVPFGHKYFTCIVGADTGATDLAGDIAEMTGTTHIRMVKTEDSSGKRQVWSSGDHTLHSTVCILHVGDLITTGFSDRLVRQGIRERGMCDRFFPILPVIVDRSNPDAPVKSVEGSNIIPLLRLKIRNYNPDNCPYCKAGSQAIKPKEGDNWQLLNKS